MPLLVEIILWFLLALLVLVALALMTPVLVQVQLTTSPQLAYRFEIRAFAGLAPRLQLTGGPRKDTIHTPKSKTAKPKRRKKTRRKNVQSSVVQAVPQLIRGLFHRLHLTELSIDADYGLGDPAETGQLSGMLMPLQYACPLPASVSLNLRPDFTQRCLNGSLTAAVRFTAAALLIPVAQFAWRAFGPIR
jgi:hypothetical protein